MMDLHQTHIVEDEMSKEADKDVIEYIGKSIYKLMDDCSLSLDEEIELKDYVDATYGQHYSKDKFQATEFIVDGGHGTGFCIGNVLKYAQRYGKKGTADDARKDLMKVLHYALIQLYVHDNEL